MPTLSGHFPYAPRMPFTMAVTITGDEGMSERDDLLASIASTIKTYRQGELPEPTPAHVDKWAGQFSAADQVPFLREFDHVIKQTFLTNSNERSR